ncbi:MAG: chemotaxis protein CheA [Burkholderiaceae bacterium]
MAARRFGRDGDAGMTQAQDDCSFIAEAMPAFVSEASEQLAEFEQLLLRLESSPRNRELLDALFRCAHTVKGSAGIFGLDRVVAFTHHVETLLDRLRDGALALTPELGTLLLQSSDQVRVLVNEGDATPAGPSTDDALRAELVRRMCAVAGEVTAQPPEIRDGVRHDASPSGRRRWRVRVAFAAHTYRNGLDPLAVIDYVRRLGEMSAMRCDAAAVPTLDIVDPEDCWLAFDFELATLAAYPEIDAAFSFVRDDCTLAIEEIGTDALLKLEKPAQLVPSIVSASPAAAVRAVIDDSRFIRVHADRLDEVINLLGELVIAGAGASLLARQTKQGSLIEANTQVTRLIEEIRNGTLQLRMVPVGETFARFRRVVRDTASELGKDVVLEIVGGETELDKSVVERIADPLTHLVRNALDHGLETPAQRSEAGKSAQGRLTLSACHESGNVLLRISDDGRGIQRDKVLQRAWERGLVDPGVVPKDDDILNLIFEPGFSTAEAVTNLSGRGVGMDVVRRNVEALRGSVAIRSQPGAGSCVELRLPLTLAIIDGFLVSVGASKFIFPLDAVVEVIEGRSGLAALDGRHRCCVDLRGQMLPVVSLRGFYGIEAPPPERCSIVVLRADSMRFGVMVDALHGQHQTVIKPLGRMFHSLRGIAGSSILGTGEVALIFDVHALGGLAASNRLPEPRSSPP